MDQVLEFASNHPIMVGAFIVTLGMLIYAEFSRRTQGFSELSPAQAVNLINQNALVVDVSAHADFQRGHILGARHFPMSQLKEGNPEIAKAKDKPMLVVCKSGHQAPLAAASLLKQGVEKVAVLKGGIQQWNSDQYPLERG